jgi:two-component system, LuxR family, sensor kinase FixL
VIFDTPHNQLLSILEQTCNALSVRRCHLASLNGNRVCMPAIWQDAQPRATQEYEQSDIAWPALHGEARYISIESDADLFPHANLLASEPVRAYAGFPLVSAAGALRGHLCVLHDSTLPVGAKVRAVLEAAAHQLVEEIDDWATGANTMLPEKSPIPIAEDDQFHMMAQHSGLAMVALAADDQVLAWNDESEHLYGFQAHEVLGQNYLARCIPTAAQTTVRKKFDAALAGASPQNYELPVVSRSGEQSQVLWHVNAIAEGLEAPARLIVIGQNVTAQRQLDASSGLQRSYLARAGRRSLLNEMMSGIAHEINQPLTAISTYAQSCLRFIDPQNPRPERLAEALEKLSQQVQRASRVIDRVRGLAQQGSNRIELVDCNQQLELIAQLAAMDLTAHGINLQLDLADNLPAVRCDPLQLQEVLLNLIQNAADAMEAIELRNGRDITLRSAFVDGTSVQISVIDCGEGVSEAAAGDLFQPFATHKATGIGMGLPISLSIMRAFDGHIDYYQNAEAGSTFVLELPIAAGGDDHDR